MRDPFGNQRDPFRDERRIDWDRMPLDELTQWHDQQIHTGPQHGKASIPTSALRDFEIPQFTVIRNTSFFYDAGADATVNWTHAGPMTEPNAATTTGLSAIEAGNDWVRWDSTNPSRISVRRDGLYAVTALVYFLTTPAGVAGGYRQAWLIVNGVTGARRYNDSLQPTLNIGGNDFAFLNLHAEHQFRAGDFFQLRVLANTGAAGANSLAAEDSINRVTRLIVRPIPRWPR